jgi:hypothetical protein
MKKIAAALKREGGVLTGIFLGVDPPEEIGSEDQYRLIMRLTVKQDVAEQSEPMTRALALTETIRQEFDAVQGIEVIDYELVSEADFSLADLRTTKRWDYDYLSSKEGTLDDIAPDLT